VSEPDVLISAAEQALRPVLGPVRVTDTEPLRSGERSTVQRIVATDAVGRRHHLVLKVPTTSGEGPVREEAALRLAAQARLPSVVRLLATSLDPPLLVLADAGKGPTLADRLLGDDAVAARDAVVGWAQTLGRLQAASVGLREAFAGELEAASPLGPPAVDSSADLLAGAAASLDRVLPALGVVPSARALAELREIADALDVALPGSPGGLVPGDTCPDNAVETDDGLVLLDLEAATYRHVAWEAAYLTVPWPSCWCSWRMPEEVVGAALDTWRSAVAPAVRVVGTPAFDDDLARATFGWVFVSAWWLLDDALRDDPPPRDHALAGLMPRRRQMLAHRFRLAAGLDTAVLPALRELASQLAAATDAAWGRPELPLAPAFRL
jgi:hypothetical protein